MKKVLIIAEAGVNHNGDIAIAKQLIDVAADAKVDFVKFQTFKAEKLVSLTAKLAKYQSENIDSDDNTQFKMLKRLEIDLDTHNKLIEYAKIKGVKFLSTAFDLDSVDLLDAIDIPIFKIPSGEITNKPYLIKIASKNKPIILSTGMSTLKEIEEALDVLVTHGAKINTITVLHCNTEYPTPMKDVNLNAMLTIKKKLGVDVGYSDHTLGIEVPIAATALGASCIEKHFTLDRNMTGPDHKASLEPQELALMVNGIRNIELALGSSEKSPSPSEIKNIIVARKSLHFSMDLEMGHIIKESDLIALRPGTGLSPMKIDKVVGKKLKISVLNREIVDMNLLY